MPAKFEVLEIRAMREIPALCEAVVMVDKRPMVLYLDKKATFVVSGSVVEIATKTNITVERLKAYSK